MTDADRLGEPRRDGGAEMTDPRIQPTVYGIRGHMVRTPQEDEAARRYALAAGSIVRADAWTALGIEPTRADLMALIHRYALARIVANVSVPTKSQRQFPAIMESHARHERDVADLEVAIVALLDRLLRPRGVCCDLRNTNCEPPAELCCRRCTEATHPTHPDGVTCVLDPDPEFRDAMVDAMPELGSLVRQPDDADEQPPWTHGTRFGRDHRSVCQHLVEDHGVSQGQADAWSDGAVHGHHDGVHRTTWAYAKDLPHPAPGDRAYQANPD